MEITVIPFNEVEIIDKIYTACRTCYAEGSPQDQYLKTQEDLTGATGWDKKWKLIYHVINSGHHSTLEHVTFTFLIKGVSRALSHQLVRHRIGVSYSQQSQRYCTLDNFTWVVPRTIEQNPEAIEEYNNTMNEIQNSYKKLLDLGIPAEDARMVLPNACCTNLVCTMNLRELIHFTDERCCTCAQSEIRQMANKMAKLVWSKIPELKPYLGPKCNSLGYCNENAQRTCGRRPIKEKALKTLQNIYELSNE